MGADTAEVAVRAARWAGVELSDGQIEQLRQYRAWILAEATRAGGLGPNERNRLWSRHLADSLTFGFVFDDPGSCVDVGTGIGLPGIPLAIMRPDVGFDLIDRSGRRCDLLRRAVRVLGLSNCTVIEQDIEHIEGEYRYLMSRAAVPLDRIMIHVKRLITPNGIGILAVSRTSRPKTVPPGPAGLTTTMVTIPVDILDSEAYLLRIEAT